MKEKNLVLITYEYPFKSKGKEYIFIKNDLKTLSDNFNRVIVVPVKSPKKKNLVKKYYDNIIYDFRLSKKINNPINLVYYLLICLIDLNFYKEIFLSKTFNLKKLKNIFTENVVSEITKKWLTKEYSEFDKNMFYSFWSNHVLLSFFKIKKRKTNFICFSRALGSDINGFYINDNFVPFIRNKFNKLNYLFILNEGQRKILTDNNLLKKELIQKNYLGITKQTFYDFKREDNKIIFLSCGNLIENKNFAKMVEFIGSFSDKYKNKNVIFRIIGNGKEKRNLIKYKNSKNFCFDLEFIDKVDNLVDYFKKNRVDFYLNFSLKEGLSFALMEAISCGIPPIVSNIPGNIEVVDNKNGYIVSKDYSNISEIMDNINFDLNNYKAYIEKKKINFSIPENKLNIIQLRNEFLTGLRKIS
tara:strand:- start:1496 stop:2737 length:1242 start_codon:yes stop_codon:yes gene_type:complete